MGNTLKKRSQWVWISIIIVVTGILAGALLWGSKAENTENAEQEHAHQENEKEGHEGEKEQGEEEKNADDIIKKYDLFGTDPKGLYLLDAELAARTYAAPSLVL